jgi:hypothetical protein
LSTSGTAKGFYALSFVSYLCPDQEYSVSASGGGTLTKDNGQIPGRSFCTHSSGVGRCAYVGQFAIGNGAKLHVILVFFTVDSDIRYAIYSHVESRTQAAVSACSPAPIGQSYIGITAHYEGCSDVIGTATDSGALPANLSAAAPLAIAGLGNAAGYVLAATGGSITFSFNPLP